jgi:hypothetical protein
VLKGDNISGVVLLETLSEYEENCCPLPTSFLAAIISGELAIISSGGDLELLLPRLGMMSQEDFLLRRSQIGRKMGYPLRKAGS